ncbi:fructose-bisphosphatase class III [Desulforhopalus singaporensis]|uniref:Fructose-1,6-bisphosphatase-3 n=1 Tax=Desulforhopalus singaporensis TaxID=91360 RepID=A0A1H0MWN8_9BACT|nr:fructose-bisphosphatase class III [Desulforhopalus singaporensis]SDO84791.1 fructose-1,6-bisphosphatase-3 [Desulforhopalus singaporensis]
MASTTNTDTTTENNTIISTSDVDQLASKLLDLELELNSNIPTTLWISDLHGEGDRFKSILRGRFGMLYQTCKEALPSTFSSDKIQYLTKIIRRQQYFRNDTITMDTQDVILCLVEVLKYKLTNIRHRSSRIFRPEFRDVITRLLSGLPVPDPIFEEPVIADRLISHLSFAVRQVLLDRIQVLGDVFDRGDQPDKILRILSSPFYRDGVDYVYGNHDILWMGAAAGNSSLVAEALRITCRYDHFGFLERLRIDTGRLAEFAERVYPSDRATGNFKAKTDRGRSMEKALSIIQFKLEEKTIREFPQYQMESRLWLDRLAEMLKGKETAGLNDTHFPTIDLDNPGRLSEEEADIISDLTYQFTTNRRLMRLLRFLFVKGKTYHIQNNFLNIHALVPSTVDGEFEEFLGRRGKGLLTHIQDTICKVGQNYLAEKPQEKEDQALFFYLWCGPKSPFFGKHAMKTFERYYLTDKQTHKERSLYWKDNMQSRGFKLKMQQEFGVQRVIYGHTPVDYTKGAQMASEDGVAINVDGGFAAAYYNRGHSLVHTPHQLYGIILPTPEEIIKAEQRLESAPLDIELIDEFRQPMKIRDTIAGRKLLAERDRIMQQLARCGRLNGFTTSSES